MLADEYLPNRCIEIEQIDLESGAICTFGLSNRLLDMHLEAEAGEDSGY